MIKTDLCDFLGIKYPIIQAGMGPFGTNKLCIAAANAGVLGLISSSGVTMKDTQPGIYNYFVETGGASLEDGNQAVLKKIFRGTLVARGFVGPARWLKTPVSQKHQVNTLKMSPGVFLGIPDDYSTVPPELIESEIAAMNAVYAGDESKALLTGGECAQRINDLPSVEDLVGRIVKEAEEVIAKLPRRLG